MRLPLLLNLPTDETEKWVLCPQNRVRFLYGDIVTFSITPINQINYHLHNCILLLRLTLSY